MEKWTEVMQKNNENLNAHIAKAIDGLKKDIAPYYFYHESSDSQYGPYYWFENITLAYKNILAGNYMQETRSMLTGLSSSMEDLSDFGGVQTSVISRRRKTNVPDVNGSSLSYEFLDSYLYKIALYELLFNG